MQHIAHDGPTTFYQGGGGASFGAHHVHGGPGDGHDSGAPPEARRADDGVHEATLRVGHRRRVRERRLGQVRPVARSNRRKRRQRVPLTWWLRAQRIASGQQGLLLNSLCLAISQRHVPSTMPI